jgi:hypothetical protein
VALQPALLGGLFIGILSALPVVNLCNCCCLWIVGGGAITAYLQQQSQPLPLTVGRGAQAGVLAGVIGAFVWLMTDQVLSVVLAPLQEMVVGQLLRNASDLPPELRGWLESVEPGGAGGRVAFFFIMLVFGSMMAALGGVIGAAYFRKDVPPALGGPIPPPPLP